MRLLGRRIGLRVTRTHGQPGEPKPMQELSDATFMYLHVELRVDLVAKIDTAPADHPVLRDFGTFAHPRSDLFFLR